MRFGFDGNFSNFLQWAKPGIYRYNINTENGTVDGPDGIYPVYGILEVLVRAKTSVAGLNVISQKVYTHTKNMKMRICTRGANAPIDTWIKGEWKTIY